MALRLARRREVDWALLLLPILWFSLPFLAQLLLGIPLYGNARQLLFITVPLAIFAALGWESVMRWLGRKWAQGLLLGLALAPGVYHLARLHPYEYIYYNELVGGVSSAEGRYELDYWCTSYRELVEQLNLRAPAGSTVAIWGPVEAAASSARSDLVAELTDINWEEAAFRMACGRGLLDEGYFAGTETLYEVRRSGALLGRVASPVETD